MAAVVDVPRETNRVYASPDDLAPAARIRSAALHLFAEKGVEATSLRMVAKAAGFSLGSVCHFFPSKAELAKAVQLHVLERVRFTMDSAESSEDPRESVARRREAYYGLFRDDPALAGYIRRQWLSGDADAQQYLVAETLMNDAERDEFLSREFSHSPTDVEVAVLLHRLVGLVPLLLAPAIKTIAGIDVMTPEGIGRWHEAEMELLWNREPQLRDVELTTSGTPGRGPAPLGQDS